MRERDALVSLAALRERREAEAEELERLRPFLPEQTVNYAERVLSAWKLAEREARVQYVTTARASELTGWHPDTLRERGHQSLSGDAMPKGWEGLLARFDAGEWGFALSTIPIKGSKAA